MANFGGITDHFGIATSDLVLVSSNKNLVAKNRADATDENADVVAATWYGAEDIFDIECVYALKSGTLNINTLKIGELEAGTIASGLTINTTNGGWPQFTMTGKLGCETVTAPTGKANTWTLPSITLKGMKAAQPIGFTVSAGKVTEVGAEFTCNIAEQTDGAGVPVAHGVDGAMMTVTAKFTNTADAQPAWTVSLSGLTSTKEPDGATEGQAAYHTTEATAEKNLTRDSAA